MPPRRPEVRTGRNILTGLLDVMRGLGVLRLAPLVLFVAMLFFGALTAAFALSPGSWWRFISVTPVNHRILLPDGERADILLGSHDVGDWQTYLAWARMDNPYLLDAQGPPALPPVMLGIRPMAHLSLGLSWAILIGATLVITLLATRLLLPGRCAAAVCIAWFSYFVISLGMIICLDRGSLQGLAVGCVGLWVWALRDRRSWLAAALLCMAILIKPYLVLLLIWPLSQRKFRDILLPVVLTAASSVLGFLLLPGSTSQSVEGYAAALTGYASADGALLYLRTNSLVGPLVHVMSLARGPQAALDWLEGAPAWLLLAPGLAWLLLIYRLCRETRLSESLRLTFVLSSSQLVLPASQIYTALWASVAILLLATERQVNPSEVVLRRAATVAVLITVAPIIILFGLRVPLSCLLSPLAWLVVGLLALPHALRRARPLTKRLAPAGQDADA